LAGLFGRPSWVIIRELQEVTRTPVFPKTRCRWILAGL
jgi:hypothetical protein